MQSTRRILSGAAAGLLLVLSSAASSDQSAAGDIEIEPTPNAYAVEANSSFLWPLVSAEAEVSAKTDLLSKAVENLTSNGMANLRRYDNALLVPMGVAALEEFAAQKGLVDFFTNFKIEPDAVVHGFGGDCDDGPDYAAQERATWGAVRVWGASVPPQYTGYAGVWIIDSGVAKYDGGELNVVERLDCTQSNCPADTKQKDKIGHGTMIAGIIGAQRNNGEGIYGLAPYVAIHALKVYKGKKALTNLSLVKGAIDYLKTKAVTVDNDPMTLSPGDVINLSLGAEWNPRANSTQSDIENGLRALANKGLKIAVAAGNIDALNGLGYVQAISPARAGGYRAPVPVNMITGGIWTASAINNTDTFWEFSAFGNFTQTSSGAVGNGPPDFAEPGEDVVSLWPGRELAQCSGTSFAAAYLSGLLVYGEPKQNARSKKDPSAEKPGVYPVDYEPNLLDWIGTNY